MRRRAIWWTLGVGAFIFLGGVIGYERSGIGVGARSFDLAVRDARAQGFEVNGDRLVEREARLPHHRAKIAYDRELVRFNKLRPKGVFAHSMTSVQRTALRPAILRLVPLSIAAEGGVAREWRLGYDLSFAQLMPYREATGVLIADAKAARLRRDLASAVRSLEAAEQLGHGMVGNGDTLSEMALVGGAVRIGNETASLLREKTLTPRQIERMKRMVDGPTFQHRDDRIVFEHELMVGIASVDRLVRASPVEMIKSPSPPDRIAPLGRVGSVVGLGFTHFFGDTRMQVPPCPKTGPSSIAIGRSMPLCPNVWPLGTISPEHTRAFSRSAAMVTPTIRS